MARPWLPQENVGAPSLAAPKARLDGGIFSSLPTQTLLLFPSHSLTQPRTSPQPSDSLLPGDGSVGVHGAAVAPGAVRQRPVGLESHLDHVGGLGARHRHRARGAARQQPRPQPRACGNNARGADLG